MKSAFLPNEGLLCLYDKQNNTWLLVDMEFLFSCSTRHLTRSLRSLVSYRVQHSKRNSISTRAHVLFSIYLNESRSGRTAFFKRDWLLHWLQKSPAESREELFAWNIYFWLVETDWPAAVMLFVVCQLLLVSPWCLRSFAVVNVVN